MLTQRLRHSIETLNVYEITYVSKPSSSVRNLIFVLNPQTHPGIKHMNHDELISRTGTIYCLQFRAEFECVN